MYIYFPPKGWIIYVIFLCQVHCIYIYYIFYKMGRLFSFHYYV